jgi:hypothetical protein
VIKKGAEKIHLIIEIQCMWNVKAKVISGISELELFQNHSDIT